MGQEYVYCTGCGVLLRERDFQRGLAHAVDFRRLCMRCRPLSTPTLPVRGHPPERRRCRA